MKQFREFNRAAAWERAEKARMASDAESERKRRERAMMARVLAAGGGRVVAKKYSGSPRMSARETERKDEWRQRMGMSAMEAGGGVQVDEGENWPLAGAGGRGRERETLMGGERDYSDGAYVDVSEGSRSRSACGGSSGGSGGYGSKGKEPKRQVAEPIVGGGDPEEMKRFTCPPALLAFSSGTGTKETPQREPQQWQEAPTKTPDYYD